MKNAESAIFSWKERIKSLRTGRGVLKIFRTGFTDFEGGGGGGRAGTFAGGRGQDGGQYLITCHVDFQN